MPRDAVIVSTARTGIGKAYRGAFNATPSPTLAAHPIRAAIERAKVDPAEVDDVIMGAALQQGVQTTIGRTAALRYLVDVDAPVSHPVHAVSVRRDRVDTLIECWKRHDPIDGARVAAAVGRTVHGCIAKIATCIAAVGTALRARPARLSGSASAARLPTRKRRRSIIRTPLC